MMETTRRLRLQRSIGGALSIALTASALTLVGAFASPAPAAAAANDTNPDFGPNVVIVDPTMTSAQINALIAPQPGNPNRQILFKPGTYGSASGQDDPNSATDIVLASVPANTAIAGLAASPTDTRINGALYVNGSGFSTLGTFARSLTNLSINPIQPGVAPHTMNWITSQTAPFRRIDITGNLDLEGVPAANPAFGNHFVNTRISGDVRGGEGRNTSEGPGEWAQAMYFVRDSEIGGTWSGFGGAFVFSGVKGAPKNDFGPETATAPSGANITLPTTPVTREAPFLYLDDGHYKVFVPRSENNSRGVDWNINGGGGASLSLNDFFIAKPTATAPELNAQLAAGKNLILTPGQYSLTEPLRITRPDSVVLGLGFATLTPTAGTAAVEVGDVPGVILSSFSVRAGTVNSDVLVRIGSNTAAGKNSGDRLNPTTLTDVHISVANPGRATVSEEINQNHVIIDGAWIRRGGSGWTTSLADHGLVVNGDSVTGLGLWVEHYQKTQILWNGQDGRVVFLQNEPPYDPPNQPGWMNGTKEGYPNLKVADNVTSFRVDGFHTYARFTGGGNNCLCYMSSAIETPVAKNVVFNGVLAGVINFPNSNGGFRNVINTDGIGVDAAPYYGTSAYPQSDVFGLTVNTRITMFSGR
ncbi:adenylyl cyclase [Microbacterium hominis]|uniref:Adenylyl cyclase n=1 Tax=Microbacterium hominis TaxID=162426 RepID=A0A7D4Q494_9MICO|nr:adenylyl cyclase [Microbacterium hominis]QKJ20531.1 adenylyl cyclase [Microbacterium hominis]